jgi:hypothetical protein
MLQERLYVQVLSIDGRLKQQSVQKEITAPQATQRVLYTTNKRFKPAVG